MKLRLTNEEIQKLVTFLLAGEDPENMLDSLDDVSRQTLETLIFQCPFCGDWNRLEDGETCPCSHFVQYYEEDPVWETHNAWIETADWDFLDEVDEFPKLSD